MNLIDATRCPYCARVRIALAEKGIEHDVTQVDLSDRPQWLRELNPPYGRVPVLDGLPESGVIMELLEELHPEPALLPADPAARARARLRCTASTRTSATTTTPIAAVTRTTSTPSSRRSRSGRASSRTSPTCRG